MMLVLSLTPDNVSYVIQIIQIKDLSALNDLDDELQRESFIY